MTAARNSGHKSKHLDECVAEMSLAYQNVACISCTDSKASRLVAMEEV
jgi:hypothetical protein